MPPNIDKRKDIEKKCLAIKTHCDSIGHLLDEGKIVSAFMRVEMISKETESLMLRNREQ